MMMKYNTKYKINVLSFIIKRQEKNDNGKKKNYGCGDTEAGTVGLERGGEGGEKEEEIEERRKGTLAM